MFAHEVIKSCLGRHVWLLKSSTVRNICDKTAAILKRKLTYKLLRLTFSLGTLDLLNSVYKSWTMGVAENALRTQFSRAILGNINQMNQDLSLFGRTVTIEYLLTVVSTFNF